VLNQVVPLLGYPAASRYVVGVGGTVLYTTGTNPDHRFLEYGWPFGGGGASPFIAAPAYQHGVAGLSTPCLVNLSQLCRGLPDVSAQSGDVLSNGYSIVTQGKDSVGGGTSLSSPLWAGMWARVNSTAPGGSYGFANETLYRLGKNPGTQARDFYDIVLGTNVQHLALPGWDYVTGWGSPDLAHLIQDAAH
jgi:subtilase family serine protease